MKIPIKTIIEVDYIEEDNTFAWITNFGGKGFHLAVF